MRNEKEKQKIGDINVDVGDGNVIGNIGHTVNINPSIQRTMGEKLRDGLLQNVSRDKLVVVWAVQGDQESLRLAEEVFGFMSSNGYNMFGEGPCNNIYTKPLGAVWIQPHSDKTDIHVGQHLP
jgi:hypothetical protein